MVGIVCGGLSDRVDSVLRNICFEELTGIREDK
jgi:hypothetical protein